MGSTDPVYVQGYEQYTETFEQCEEYGRGGCHPTHLEDLLDGRYKVLLKLGHGGYGMVWLCRDTKEKKWRAVKILQASASEEDFADLRVCSAFSGMDPQRTEVSHSRVAVALDYFWMDGLNDTHLCFVMPLLGPNLEGVAEKYRYEEAPLMRICYQLVQAMGFLHNKGVRHGDFRPPNVCFTLKNIDNLEEDDMIRIFGRPKLKRLVDDAEFREEGSSAGERFSVGGEEISEDGNSADGEIDVDASNQEEEEAQELNLPRYLVANS